MLPGGSRTLYGDRSAGAEQDPGASPQRWRSASRRAGRSPEFREESVCRDRRTAAPGSESDRSPSGTAASARVIFRLRAARRTGNGKLHQAGRSPCRVDCGVARACSVEKRVNVAQCERSAAGLARETERCALPGERRIATPLCSEAAGTERSQALDVPAGTLGLDPAREKKRWRKSGPRTRKTPLIRSPDSQPPSTRRSWSADGWGRRLAQRYRRQHPLARRCSGQWRRRVWNGLHDACSRGVAELQGAKNAQAHSRQAGPDVHTEGVAQNGRQHRQHVNTAGDSGSSGQLREATRHPDARYQNGRSNEVTGKRHNQGRYASVRTLLVARFSLSSSEILSGRVTNKTPTTDPRGAPMGPRVFVNAIPATTVTTPSTR